MLGLQELCDGVSREGGDFFPSIVDYAFGIFSNLFVFFFFKRMFIFER